MSNDKRFFSPPVFADEETTRTAALLNIILWVFCVISFIYLIALLATDIDHPQRYGIVILQLLLIWGLRRLLFSGWVWLASLLLVFDWWLNTTFFALNAGGIYAPSASSYGFVIMLAGLLLGGRSAIAFAGLAILVRLLMLWAESFGLSPSTTFTSPPALIWFSESLSYGFSALLLYLAARSLNTALAHLRKNEAALAASNQHLQTHHSALEEQQAALQAQEAFANAILNSLASHIAVLDQEGKIVAINQAWERFARNNGGTGGAATGVGADYLAVCGQATGVDAVYAQAAAAGIQAVLNGAQDHFTLEYPCFSPTQEAWYFLLVTPLTLPMGGAVVAHTDISERKQAEMRLAQNETRYRALIKAIPDILVRLSANGDYLDIEANQNFVSAVPVDQVLGKNVCDMLPEALANQFLYYNRQALATGQLQQFEFDIALNNRTYRREARIVPENNDKVLVILRDVTERTQVETALRESEERYRKLVELSPDTIFINRADQIVYANSACFQLLRADRPEQILGRSPLEFTHPDYQAMVKQRMAQVISQGKALPVVEQRLLRCDGTEVDVEVTAVAIQDKGAVAIQSIVRDITTRKLIEAQKAQLLKEVDTQRLQLRSLNRRLAEAQENERQALARELHDQVGQNLTALGLNLNIMRMQLLARLPAADESLVRLDDSRQLLQQTTRLVRNVMVELRPPLLDERGLVAALQWYSEQIAERTGLQITVAASNPKPILPETVALGLFRVAQEALTNVIKHAQATFVRIGLTVEAKTARLTIADNGRGLAAAQAEKASDQQGWGVLTMQERAEIIGGRCWVESMPGQGTEVIVEVQL